ncbi:HNH endonuclease [Ruegeria lacuscaerulensis]|uniref:HNH endonuclease n=1 Tax=Ruegeria lacuscaerulensis TaxID=55218 RepID=UPI00147FEA02|nr:HNH endonuclease signature motif containing protein [Ruegeria lacuscaerulensis]
MTFEAIGIDRKVVQAAIEQTKHLSETDIPGERNPSQSTYVLCPVDRTLWDLKIVVQFALETVPKPRRPKLGWVTTRFEPDLRKLGFDLVKFQKQRGRLLGVRGFDPKELDDPHLVKKADGTEYLSGLSVDDTEIDNSTERRVVRTSQFVRNSDYVKAVKTRANGRCESCGQQTFRTGSGEWFLEVHHKVWLSEGGADEPSNMVALCPNCHRSEHFSTERKYG